MRPAVHVILISIAATLCSADEASPTAPLKSEIPPVFTANTESFDFVRRTEMIPMRDGVKLYTVILIPRGAGRAQNRMGKLESLVFPMTVLPH